jgi:hypothetical protein
MKDIDPLNLDPGLSSEYLQVLLNNSSFYYSSVLDEVEYCYQEDVDDMGERLELIDAVHSQYSDEISDYGLDIDYD